MLQEAAIGLAGEQTAIGDAIGLATKRLEQQAKGKKVMILLTDGASNAGEVAPLKAAEIAAQAGITIYTVGIGADELEVPTPFGIQRIRPGSDIDEASLQSIAETTGGRYFRARNTAQLSQIYALLDIVQPVVEGRQTFRPRTTLFYWPLAASLLMAVLVALPPVRGTTA